MHHRTWPNVDAASRAWAGGVEAPPAVLDIQEFAAGFGHLSFQSRLDKVAELLPDSQDRVRLRALYQSVSNFEAHGSFAAVGKYISVAPLVFEATPVCGDPAAVLDVDVLVRSSPGACRTR